MVYSIDVGIAKAILHRAVIKRDNAADYDFALEGAVQNADVFDNAICAYGVE